MTVTASPPGGAVRVSAVQIYISPRAYKIQCQRDRYRDKGRKKEDKPHQNPMGKKSPVGAGRRYGQRQNTQYRGNHHIPAGTHDDAVYKKGDACGQSGPEQGDHNQ